MRSMVFLVLMGVLLGCRASLRSDGQRCTDDDECALGFCRPAAGGVLLCTRSCAEGESCPTVYGSQWVCGGGGYCQAPCSAGSTSGSGAGTQLCVGGAFVPCSMLDPVADCARCGCEPFGGGVCLTSMGCVQPRADGEACTADPQCQSGACYRDSHVCGAPRVMGSPCSVDAECADHNCSTDGDASSVGVCNQALGSACTNASTTCTSCLRWDSFSPGMCSRAYCDPVNANHCPVSGDRIWGCAMSTDGRYRCYEECRDSGALSYQCLLPLEWCQGDYCF